MPTNILKFPSEKTLRDNLPVSDCLDQAKRLGLSSVVIMGYTKDGEFFFSASEEVTNENTLFLLKCAERSIFNDF